MNKNDVDRSLIRDVIIPNRNDGTKQIRTDGFEKYTKLVKDNAQAYKQLPSKPGIKRQFAIDNIVTPLREVNRRFYSYNPQNECYELIDLNNETQFNKFVSSVMQKINDADRDARKKKSYTDTDTDSQNDFTPLPIEVNSVPNNEIELLLEYLEPLFADT